MKKKFNKLKKLINGPVFSIQTPFLKNGNIDFIGLEKYLKFLCHRGAKIFYIMVYNSRLTLLNKEEIIKLNIFCIRVIKKINPDNVVICAEPYQCSTKESIGYVNKFASAGADLVSVIFGEKYYSDAQLLSHFKMINDKAKCPLLLHQQFLENGMSSDPLHRYYSVDLLSKIFNLKKFVAMKEDAKKEKYTLQIIKKLNKVIIIKAGGGKTSWLRMAKAGCPAWLCGVSNMDPLIAVDFYKFYKVKNFKKCQLLIRIFELPLNKLMKKYGWHITIKGMMEINKVIKRYERSPLKELNNDQMIDVKKCYKQMFKLSYKYFGTRYLAK